MLKELKQILKSSHQMPLKELSAKLGLDPSSTKQLLLFYLRKGEVIKLPEGTLCSHCTSCKPEAIEIYQWVNSKSSTNDLKDV
jgi:putative ferrous iron transport protein C